MDNAHRALRPVLVLSARPAGAQRFKAEIAGGNIGTLRWGRHAMQVLLASHKIDMAAFRTSFDRWFHESELHAGEAGGRLVYDVSACVRWSRCDMAHDRHDLQHRRGHAAGRRRQSATGQDQ